MKNKYVNLRPILWLSDCIYYSGVNSLIPEIIQLGFEVYSAHTMQWFNCLGGVT